MPRKKSSPKPSTPFQLRLRSFKTYQSNADQHDGSINSKKPHWRQQRKSDPKQYKALLQCEAVEARVRRAEKMEDLNLPGNEAKKREYLARNAKRQREYRAKKKLQREAEEKKKQADKSKKPVKRTRAEMDKEAKRKEIQAAKKREQRARLSDQKKQQILDRRRQKRREEKEECIRQQQMIQEQEREILEAQAERKRLEEEEKRLAEEEKRLQAAWQQLEDMGQHEERSQDARRQSLKRARSSLSQDPKIYAETVEDLVQRASPRKKRLLHEKGITTDVATKIIYTTVSQKMSSLRKSRKKKDGELKRIFAPALQIAKRYRCQKRVCEKLKTTAKTLKLPSFKPHARLLPNKTKQTIQRCYEENSITLPDKKLVSKKTKKATGFLTMTIRALHGKFQKDNPEMKVCLSKFADLKPAHIKTRHSITYRGCLCEYCANIELKLTAINKLANHSLFENIYQFSDATMCTKKQDQKYHKLPCIQRKCKNCGTSQLDVAFQELREKHEGHVNWRKWERESKEEKGKKTHRMVLNTKQGTLEDLLEELKGDAKSISQHLFTAAWQSNEFQQISKSPPDGWIILVCDFAENYSCRFQDEVQSVHWGHESATIHPVISYYRCPNCRKPVTESLIMITADNNHDHHAVHQFTALAINHLKKKLGDIKKIVRFSDGAGSQYKSRSPFLDISYGKEDYCTAFQHEYFGSRHGKGPSDGESGVVKRLATDAVMSGSEVIANARDLYKFIDRTATLPKEGMGEDGDCIHFFRKAFWLESIDRKRDRHARKTVAGTRQFHSILSIKPNVIGVRKLSCFCKACSEDTGSCTNTEYVQPYVITTMVGGAAGAHTTSRENVMPETEPTNPNATTTATNPDATTMATNPDATTEAANPDTTTEATNPDATIDATNPDATTEATNSDSMASNPVPSTDAELDYKVGDYVAVIYDDAWWAGEVTDVNGSMCHVNFLTQKGPNKFCWPTQKDDAWVAKTGIFRRLPCPPAPVTSRYLGFDTQLVKDISLALATYLEKCTK